MVINITFNAAVDSKFGPDDSLGASVQLIESARYGGGLVVATAKVVHEKKSIDKKPNSTLLL